MTNFLTAMVRNTVFANILMMTIIFGGLLAVVMMVREQFPNFSSDMIRISVPYPGADPEEVEEGICRKIEEAVDGLEGIKEYTTYSSENSGTAMIEVLESYDMDDVKERVRNAIDSISTFPVDAEKPVVAELTIRHEVMTLALSGQMDERTLKEHAEEIRDELRAIPGVSQVEIDGGRPYEIGIEVSEERLRELGLTFNEVASAVRRSSVNMPGGTLRTRGEEIRIRTVGRKYTGAEFAGIVIMARPNGDVITLDQIAEIKDAFEEDPIFSFLNDQPAIVIEVLKTEEEDSLAISAAIQAYIVERSAALPPNVTLSILNDHTDMIRSRINLMLKNGLIGLALVFLILWWFLDFRLSFWAAMGIPISLSGALMVLWLMGETINMISLFGLIMITGIVVDDAIVIAEAIYVHRKNGEGPIKAAVEGVKEVGLPVIAAVLTTVVAFIPLMFVGGIMGKFIRIMPITVIMCLLVSLVEGLILLPAHLNHLPDPNSAHTRGPKFWRKFSAAHRRSSNWIEYHTERLYIPFCTWALKWRYVVFCAAVGVLMLTVGLVQGGVVKMLMFPPVPGNTLTATIEFPNGTPIETTQRAISRMEEAFGELAKTITTFSGEPPVEYVFTLVGSAMGENSSTGSHTGSVRIELVDDTDRDISSTDLELAWEEAIGEIPGAVSLTFSQAQGGPRGRPIEIWLQGESMDTLLAAADDLKAKLATFDGVYQIESDFRPGKNELRLKLKNEARNLGLTVADLAGQVRAGYFGEEAVRLQRGRDDIRVRVRYPEGERSRLAQLDQVRIRTPQGSEVPLWSVADAEYGPGFSTIIRTDGQRRVVVSADVNVTKANAQDILDDLSSGTLTAAADGEAALPFFQQLRAKYHNRLSIALQGEERSRRESLGSLRYGFPLALFGIFVIVATVFRSYVQPLVIMLTVPFGIIGAVLGHILLSTPLSLMSMFGIVALTGVVVNDAIVLIERFNNYMGAGVPFYDALPRAGARRFRAIILTTASTVGGLAPIILETDRQAQWLIPMALSIASGVAFATMLTLVLIPCTLAILNDVRRALYRLKSGAWPTPEAVEPGVLRDVDIKELTAADALSMPISK